MTDVTVDLDRVRATHEPWSFRAGGRLHVAQPVSVEQVVRYDAATRGASQSEILTARRRLLRIAFPWRPSYIWHGDPVALLCNVGPAVHAEMWASFWLSLQSLSRPSSTNGSGSTSNS